MEDLKSAVKERLMDCLTRNGIEILSDPPEYDSLSFITAIVDIETEFDITFPDEFLTIESLNSIETLLDIVNLQLLTKEANGHQA